MTWFKRVKVSGELGQLQLHYELGQVSSVLSNQHHELLRIRKALPKLPLDAFFLARISRRVEVVRVMEIERKAVMRLPRRHETVVVHVVVAVKGDVGLISVCHQTASRYGILGRTSAGVERCETCRNLAGLKMLMDKCYALEVPAARCDLWHAWRRQVVRDRWNDSRHNMRDRRADRRINFTPPMTTHESTGKPKFNDTRADS